MDIPETQGESDAFFVGQVAELLWRVKRVHSGAEAAILDAAWHLIRAYQSILANSEGPYDSMPLEMARLILPAGLDPIEFEEALRDDRQKGSPGE